MPLDGIVMGKSQMELALEARGYGVGFIQAWAGHSWITNLSYEERDFNFLKNRRDRGPSEAMDYRDSLAPEGFNIKKSKRVKAST
jgi:enoyl-CoA hydratase